MFTRFAAITFLGCHVAQLNAQAVVTQQPKSTEPPTRAEIAKLVGLLQGLKDPDVGISPTLSGSAFAPISGSARMHVGLITDHRLKSFEPFRRLVEIGPDAIPVLLDALTDEAPTKLKVQRGLFSDSKQPYVVVVADVCYVILGQIVGRPYRAVSYVPTGLVAIDSPAKNPKLREELRKQWSAKDPRAHLRRALVADYEKKLTFNGSSLDGWDSDTVVQAGMRLLFYFPKEYAPILAARLRSLDVMDAGNDINKWIRREVKNGVRSSDFIEAIAWCEEAVIRDALADIAKRTNDKSIKSALERKK